jgi:LacI family transcriptional regulator
MDQPPTHLLDRALISRQRTAPLHQQVRILLRQLIEDKFEDGQGFWTESFLMESLDVSRATIRKAIAELSREGLLISRAGKGTFVTKKIQPTSIGFFMHQYNSDFQSEMLHALAEECRQRKLDFQPHHTHNGQLLTKAFEHAALHPSLQRFIILGTEAGYTNYLYEALNERGYRTVLIDTISPGFSGAYVGTDNAAVVQLGMDHLRSLGHKRIVLLVNEPAAAETVQRKIGAFKQIVNENNLTECSVYICGTQFGESSFDAAYNAIPKLWLQVPRPTAFFTVSDPGAWAVLKWFAEQGVKVPDEVSVLGFEGVVKSNFTYPTLTTVAHPIKDIIRIALDLLWEKERRHVYVPPYLVAGRSTGISPA